MSTASNKKRGKRGPLDLDEEVVEILKALEEQVKHD